MTRCKNEDGLRNMRAIAKFQQTSLPFQYLGCPILSRKPNRRIFSPILVKMQKKIRGMERETVIIRKKTDTY